MSQQSVVYQWTEEIRKRMRHLSEPQSKALAAFSVGIAKEKGLWLSLSRGGAYLNEDLPMGLAELITEMLGWVRDAMDAPGGDRKAIRRQGNRQLAQTYQGDRGLGNVLPDIGRPRIFVRIRIFRISGIFRISSRPTCVFRRNRKSSQDECE